MNQKVPLEHKKIVQEIQSGSTALGIELGSTRIKAVLIDERYAPVASGAYEWENRWEDGVWTYHLEDVWTGLQTSVQRLSEEVQAKYQVPLKKIGVIGISAMMHGYLVFGADGGLLAPFRTWRNTMTEQAAALLTEEFQFNIPQRWSIAHLYQAVLNQEPHVKDIAFLTTLAGYVHWRLTGEKVVGIGEASGIFPVNSAGTDYDEVRIKRFDALVSQQGVGWRLRALLPQARAAGVQGGVLTEEGARLLDPSGQLEAGIPLCPPEGDAGTGMVATNSVVERSGNVSAGTSAFAMVVLEKPMAQVHEEIDMITTPAGKPVAMVHCNNCTTDLNAWVRLFGEAGSALGAKVGQTELYEILYNKALEGDADCGGVLSYNYHSGEHITGFEQGRPMVVRMPDGQFHLANLMRSLLFSSMATLRIGMDILTGQEEVRLDQILGHGGLFKTKGVGQRLMAAALGVPVTVMESAGEGGAWGIALLAAYCLTGEEGESLEAFLSEKVFGNRSGTCIKPDPKDQEGFERFMKRYREGLPIHWEAVKRLL